MQDSRQAQYVVKHFNRLLGLRIIPLGLYAIFLATWGIWLRPFLFPMKLSSLEILIFFILMEVVLIGLTLLINRYYQRILGPSRTSEPGLQESTRQRGTLILLFFIYLIGTSIDLQEHLPLSVFGLLVATSMFFYWWQMGRVQIQYSVLAPVVAILSLLPLLSGAMHSQIFFNGSDQYWNIVQTIIGVVLIVCGIGDHLLLLRVLKFAGNAAGQHYEEDVE